MNTPATENGNWEWRLTEGSLTDVAAARLKELSLIYGRV
jgi:4-alpha-glucanotransferase